MRLPSTERLEYLKLLAETVLVLLVVPVLIIALFRDPKGALEHAAGRIK